MEIINALMNVPIIYGALGGFGVGVLITYFVCRHQIRKAVKARKAKAAQHKAARERVKREQKFCHDWAETMELGAKNWGLQ